MRQGDNIYLEHSDDVNNTRGFVKMVGYSLKRWGLLGSIARFLLMKSEMKRFIQSKPGGLHKNQLYQLLKDFKHIQANITCAHTPYQFVLVAKYIFDLDLPGPIIQCGCYKGGSSAELSLVAKLTSRELYICDSFAGLPTPQNDEEARLEGYDDARPSFLFRAGEYCGTLEEVKENMRRCGCIDVCTFVQGFFKDSLKDLHVQPACVFIDVDLVSSARDCLKYLWPRTVNGGLWFTHEAGLPRYIEGILDPEWWQATLNEKPPIIFGAGSGLSECATGLACFWKKSALVKMV